MNPPGIGSTHHKICPLKTMSVSQQAGLWNVSVRTKTQRVGVCGGFNYKRLTAAPTQRIVICTHTNQPLEQQLRRRRKAKEGNNTMSRTYKRSPKDDYTRELYIRSKRRVDPDLRLLARALIEIAQAEAEAEAAHAATQSGAENRNSAEAPAGDVAEAKAKGGTSDKAGGTARDKVGDEPATSSPESGPRPSNAGAGVRT
jgi:hypothetical protein